MSYTQVYYHIVFSTKGREPVLSAEGCPELLKYVWGTIKNKNCHLYRINAVEDHLHIFSDLHPTIDLASYVKAIKVGSSMWIKERGLFPGFRNWQEKYGAFTHSFVEKDRLIAYVKNQQEHHQTESFIDEFRRLLDEAGIKYDPKYLD